MTTSAAGTLCYHSAARHLLLHLPDSLFDLRAALGLFRLVAQFLLGHAQ